MATGMLPVVTKTLSGGYTRVEIGLFAHPPELEHGVLGKHPECGREAACSLVTSMAAAESQPYSKCKKAHE